MALELPYGYKNLNPDGSSNADESYGYYDSLQEAYLAVPLAMRKGGRTVGIKDGSGKITEYWWENDNDLSDEGLVEKVNKADLEIITDASLFFNPLTKELRANVSDFSEKYTYTSGVQEFVLISTPAKIIYISVNGQLLEDPLTQWSIDVPTKTITILDEMDTGDRVTIHYQYFITI